MPDNYSKFFDEDGNIIMTQRDLDRINREREEARLEEERKQKESLREMNKELEQDEKSRRFEERFLENKRQKAIQQDWSNKPLWLKKMKEEVIPLDDPPTEGKKEMLKYKLSRKVELTESEKRDRIKIMRNFKQALDDHNNIDLPLPNGSPLSPVTIVSLGNGSGGSTLTKCISSALQLSRSQYGNCISIDLSGHDSAFSKYYTKHQSRMNLRFFLKAITSDKYASISPESIIDNSNNRREMFLSNIDDLNSRVTAGIPDVINIYKYLRQLEGFILFDCDYNNMDALLSSMILSNNVIFVVEPLEECAEKIKDILSRYRELVGNDPNSLDILNNIDIVIMANDARLMTKNNLVALNSLVKLIGSKVGVYDEDSMHLVYYDKALTKYPIEFQNVKPFTAHPIRVLTGKIVGNAIKRNS